MDMNLGGTLTRYTMVCLSQLRNQHWHTTVFEFHSFFPPLMSFFCPGAIQDTLHRGITAQTPLDCDIFSDFLCSP